MALWICTVAGVRVEADEEVPVRGCVGVVDDPVVGDVAGEVGEERRRGVLAVVCRSGDSVSSSHWKMREVMDAQISM